MTIKQLLSCSAKELEGMNDEQLLNYLRPYIKPIEPRQAQVNGDGVLDLTGVKSPKIKQSKEDTIKDLEAMLKARL